MKITVITDVTPEELPGLLAALGLTPTPEAPEPGATPDIGPWLDRSDDYVESDSESESPEPPCPPTPDTPESTPGTPEPTPGSPGPNPEPTPGTPGGTPGSPGPAPGTPEPAPGTPERPRVDLEPPLTAGKPPSVTREGVRYYHCGPCFHAGNTCTGIYTEWSRHVRAERHVRAAAVWPTHDDGECPDLCCTPGSVAARQEELARGAIAERADLGPALDYVLRHGPVGTAMADPRVIAGAECVRRNFGVTHDAEGRLCEMALYGAPGTPVTSMPTGRYSNRDYEARDGAVYFIGSPGLAQSQASRAVHALKALRDLLVAAGMPEPAETDAWFETNLPRIRDAQQDYAMDESRQHPGARALAETPGGHDLLWQMYDRAVKQGMSERDRTIALLTVHGIAPRKVWHTLRAWKGVTDFAYLETEGYTPMEGSSFMDNNWVIMGSDEVRLVVNQHKTARRIGPINYTQDDVSCLFARNVDLRARLVNHALVRLWEATEHGERLLPLSADQWTRAVKRISRATLGVELRPQDVRQIVGTRIHERQMDPATRVDNATMTRMMKLFGHADLGTVQRFYYRPPGTPESDSGDENGEEEKSV